MNICPTCKRLFTVLCFACFVVAHHADHAPERLPHADHQLLQAMKPGAAVVSSANVTITPLTGHLLLTGAPPIIP